MKFDLRKFVMDTLKKMQEDGYSEAQVREYALNWYVKGVLKDEDLMEIEEWFAPEPEPVVDEEWVDEEPAIETE